MYEPNNNISAEVKVDGSFKDLSTGAKDEQSV